MKTFVILYSRTKTGAVQQWQIEVEGNKFRTTEGQVGGVQTTSNWTICEGKSIGKKNETSPEQQALKEAKARWDKKQEEGYWINIEDIDKKKFFEPMLAFEFEEKKSKITYPVYIQPKFDGLRCIITKDGMFSRNGKEFVSCPHIFESVKQLFDIYPELILDGELYNHELKNDFNKIISLVRKTKPSTQDIEESKSIVEYHCYDCGCTGYPLTFSDRDLFLKDILKHIIYVSTVETIMAFSESDVKSLHDKFVSEGYEGCMVRSDKFYENGRSNSLLKLKMFKDEEFEILDIEEGAGNRSGMMGRIKFKTKEGKEFSASAKGDENYYRELLNNKQSYIGQMATVKYQNLTPDGIPRFPTVIAIRNYE